LIKNVIKPNLPNIRIIISLDEITPYDFSSVAGLCLHPFLSYITILGRTKRSPRNKRSPVPTELLLMTKALDYIASKNETFDYIIKVRTDNMVLSPIPKLSVLYGHFNETQHHGHLKNFQNNLSKIYNRNPTIKEVIYSWIISGGMNAFIKSMTFPSPPPHYRKIGGGENRNCFPWCFKNSTEWNKNIQKSIEDDSTLLDDNKFSISALQSSIRDTMSRFKIVYLIGSTWYYLYL
jgi:hypothetical protein